MSREEFGGIWRNFSLAMSGLRVLKVLGSLPDMFKIQHNYRYRSDLPNSPGSSSMHRRIDDSVRFCLIDDSGSRMLKCQTFNAGTKAQNLPICLTR